MNHPPTNGRSTGRSRSRRAAVTIAALGLALAAPAAAPAMAGTQAPASGDEVTIDWWHIQNTEPSMSNWQAVADQFEADHPGVQIEITVMENEAFKAAIQTNMQAGDVPDLFQSWGGGGLLQQVEAGLVQDISEGVGDVSGDLTGTGSFEVDGALYGLPWKVGMVGFWYNVDLFDRGRARRARRHLGRAARADPDPQGRRHHADRGGRRRQVARALLVLVPDGPAVRQRRDARDRSRQRLLARVRGRGRPQDRGAGRPGTLPRGLPRRRVGRARRRVGHDGQCRARRWT